jgi:putative ABC transport system substrate-binding protein
MYASLSQLRSGSRSLRGLMPPARSPSRARPGPAIWARIAGASLVDDASAMAEGGLGYRGEEHFLLESRFAELQPDRLPARTQALARLSPGVLVTHAVAAAWAVMRATLTTPIVVGVAVDLVEQGLLASLGHPWGNLTGFELRDLELLRKRLELLKGALPQIAPVVVLIHPWAHHQARIPGALDATARANGVSRQWVEVADPKAFQRALAMAEARTEALVLMDPMFVARYRCRLLDRVLRHRLPTMAGGTSRRRAASSPSGPMPTSCTDVPRPM